jgi:hypothetical protein
MIVNYLHPVVGTTAPTAEQTKDMVVASIDATTSPNTAVVVHNMGLTTAQIAMGWPIVSIEPVTVNARTASWIVTLQSANQTTLVQLSAAGSTTGSIILTIRRPHTIGN